MRRNQVGSVVGVVGVCVSVLTAAVFADDLAIARPRRWTCPLFMWRSELPLQCLIAAFVELETITGSPMVTMVGTCTYGMVAMAKWLRFRATCCWM